MPDVDCQAGTCLLGALPGWLLVAWMIGWPMVTALAAARWVRHWTPWQQCTGHQPAHKPVPGPQLRSARTVAEIQHRLTTEATRPPPSVRNIQVIARTAPPTPPLELWPSDADLDTDPFDQPGRPDHGDHDGDADK